MVNPCLPTWVVEFLILDPLTIGFQNLLPTIVGIATFWLEGGSWAAQSRSVFDTAILYIKGVKFKLNHKKMYRLGVFLKNYFKLQASLFFKNA